MFSPLRKETNRPDWEDLKKNLKTLMFSLPLIRKRKKNCHLTFTN